MLESLEESVGDIWPCHLVNKTVEARVATIDIPRVLFNSVVLGVVGNTLILPNIPKETICLDILDAGDTVVVVVVFVVAFLLM